MGILYLIRHGQASFGAADYDQLSDLGQRQSVQLGRHLAAQGLSFDAVLSGTLRRHTQTLTGIQEGLTSSMQAVQWPGLNEYDSEAIIAAVHPEPLDRSPTPDNYRHHFRLLRSGLHHWMLGKTQPVGMPAWGQFRDQVVAVLDHVRQSGHEKVLLVSSGGPIACALGHVLQTPSEATVELNMRLRNSSVSEMVFTEKRFSLQTYNTLSHLDAPDFAGWATHA